MNLCWTPPPPPPPSLKFVSEAPGALLVWDFFFSMLKKEEIFLGRQILKLGHFWV